MAPRWTNVSRICHERQLAKKNSLSWTVLKALLSKDILNARWHFGFLTFQAVLPLLVIAGNALAWVQRVHAPADLWDITFCTR